MPFDWDKFEDASAPETSRELASPQQPEEEVGYGETALRGGLQGLSLGTSEEAMAGLETLGDLPQTGFDWQKLKDQYEKHVELQRAREAAASEQNPLTYQGSEIAAPFAVPVLGALGKAGKLGATLGGLAESAQVFNVPGKIVEGTGTALEALPGAAKLTKSLPNVARVVKGGVEGATLGGLYGAGKTENSLTSEQGLEDIKNSAEFGGVFGGGLSALAAGAHMGAVKGAGKQGVVGDISRSYLAGIEGKNLTDFNKIADQAFDYSQVTGNRWMQDEVQRIKQAFNAFQEAGEVSGQKANIADIFDSLNNMKQQAENVSDPAAQKTINQLIGLFENKAYGLEELVQKNQMVLNKTELPGQEGTPATKDQMQAKVNKLNKDAEATAAQTGEPIKQYQVVKDVRDGQEFLNIKEITPPGAEGVESAKVINKDWLPSEETVAAVDPSVEMSLDSEPFFVKERPGNTPELGMNDIVDLEKKIGQDKQSASLEPAQRNIYNEVDRLITGKAEQIEPGYAEPREQWKQMLNALDKAGINKNNAVDFDIGAVGLEEKLNSVAPEVMQNVNRDILTSIDSGYESKVATENLDRFFNMLQKAGYEDIPTIREQLEQNMRDYDLSRKMNRGQVSPGLASHNPKVAAIGALKSMGAKGAHYAGLAQSVPVAQQLSSVLPGVVTGQISNQQAGQNSIQTLSKNLSYSNTEDLTKVTEALKMDKNLAHYGTALESAIKSGDSIKKNSIIFAISQNPQARKLLETGQR
jgi:hypothetical protein